MFLLIRNLVIENIYLKKMVKIIGKKNKILIVPSPKTYCNHAIIHIIYVQKLNTNVMSDNEFDFILIIIL